VVIINRRGHEDVALVPAGELESLVETAHLRDDRIDVLQARYHYQGSVASRLLK
jgi:PHD/YefM family antitoxin component YafN of YafNO toxin-antitoxin module